MSIKQRFLQHLKEKKAIPESYNCGGMAKGYSRGGMIEEEDINWDGDWNEQDEDTSGEPMYYMAFGGRINPADEQGTAAHNQPDDMMSEEEVRRHLARAVSRRKQLRGA